MRDRIAVRNVRKCEKDCLCLYVCPTGASDTENSVIDAEKCIGCGACADACPAGAISMVPKEYPPQQEKKEAVIAALRGLVSSKSEQEQLAALEAAAGEIVITAPLSGSIHNLTSRYAPGDLLPANTELCSVYGSEGLRFYGSSSTGAFVYGREVSIKMGRGGRSMTVTGPAMSAAMPEMSVISSE